jgi:fucose 4-O-acetylase-like acetyltransferase
MDDAKGIAIVLIVYGHAAGSLLTTLQVPERGAIAFSCFFVYTFHVPTFFFFAGFFARKIVDRDPSRLVSRSVKFVFLPYFFWSLTYCTFALALAPYVHHKISWMNLVSIVYHPYLQFWFLYALFLAHVTLYATRGVPRRWLILLAAASYAVSFSLGETNEANILRSAMHFFLFYAIGAAAPGLMKLISGRVDRVLVSFLLVLGAAFLSFAGRFNYQAVASLPATAAGVWFILELARWLGSRSWLSLFRVCGNLSLPIYILHTFASAGTRVALEAVGIHIVAVQLCASTLLGVTLPIATYAALSRWDLLGWFALSGPQRTQTQPFPHGRQDTRTAIAPLRVSIAQALRCTSAIGNAWMDYFSTRQRLPQQPQVW